MKNVNRYNASIKRISSETSAVEFDKVSSGDWVKYSDYEKVVMELQDKIKNLETQLEESIQDSNEWHGTL